MDRFVYHSSNHQGLKELHPKSSNHKQKWVYATKDLAMSALFIGNYGGDFTCFIDRDNKTGLPIIVERFENAIEKRYKDIKGSIYILPSDSFLEDKTGWIEEVVADKTVKVIDEIIINDAMEYLLKLEEQKKLIIMRYPKRPDNIPEDDEDLVIKAVAISRDDEDKKENILNLISNHHPQLINRVDDAIKNNMFASIDNLNKLKPRPNAFVRFTNMTLDVFAGGVLIGIGIYWFLREGIIEGIIWSLFGLSLITGSNGARYLFKVPKDKKMGFPDIVSLGLTIAGIGMFIYWLIRY